MGKKFYYLIEDIDIDGDKNSDGFLITKYKIDKKTLDKIFIKSKYVSFEKYKKIIKKNKGGDNSHYYHNQHYNQPRNQFQNYNNIPYMNHNQFNKYMNNPQSYNQHQPQVLIAHHQPNMAASFMDGLSGGLGAGIGLGIMDGIFDFF